MSLARSLLHQVAHLVAENGGGAVQTIRVQCGPLSGIEPVLLSSAFELLRQQPVHRENGLADADLLIEHVPLEAQCRQCHEAFEPAAFRFLCPECGSGETDILRGDGLILESIEIEESMQGESA